jgi:two-component system OmpR family response regulator
VVLVADRERAAHRAAALRAADYTVALAHDGLAGEYLGATEQVSAAVLDLGLPGLDGVEVLRRWRAQGLGFPVLILSARDAWADKVAGFRAGADDYVLKPFRMEEIVLRLAVLLRRQAGHATPEIGSGRLRFDTTTSVATLDGLPLRLTAFETRLLRQLLLARGRVLSRAELAEQLYADEADRDLRSLEVLIGRLRRKIAPVRIEARRGAGYQLMPEEGA